MSQLWVMGVLAVSSAFKEIYVVLRTKVIAYHVFLKND